ncbi:MAG: hypothetical protein LKE54_03685 [Prevotella sp.]|jgi:hypothetical protein|nr:hypothetical protein [Prevotella sp.]MCH3994148.1 hypothetical protein [Prevotella sp.]
MVKHIKGFVQMPEDGEKIERREAEYVTVLNDYFAHNKDSGRWTSQDIVDNLRDTIDLKIEQVFRYMKDHGYHLERDDDRMVWVIE